MASAWTTRRASLLVGGCWPHLQPSLYDDRTRPGHMSLPRYYKTTCACGKVVYTDKALVNA